MRRRGRLYFLKAYCSLNHSSLFIAFVLEMFPDKSVFDSFCCKSSIQKGRNKNLCLLLYQAHKQCVHRENWSNFCCFIRPKVYVCNDRFVDWKKNTTDWRCWLLHTFLIPQKMDRKFILQKESFLIWPCFFGSCFLPAFFSFFSPLYFQFEGWGIR